MAEMPRVRELFPEARGLERFDVVVEALLLAAGVPEGAVPEIARRYRAGSGAHVDLSPYTAPSRRFANLETAVGLIRGELEGRGWVSSNEIHQKFQGQIAEGMFGRVKSALGIEHRRVKSEASGKVQYEWRLPSSGWDVMFDGTPEEVRELLEARLGTDDFTVTPEGKFRLRLPHVGKDRRPRTTGETTVVEVDPISEWSVEAPAREVWWHAVPRGSVTTYCTIDTTKWHGDNQRDDTHEITCPWCRVRLIALEIVAPPGPRRIETEPAERRIKLHDEIGRILRAHGDWMTLDDVARAVREAGRYRKHDGTSNVTAYQIHGRTREGGQYSRIFERDGQRVRLRPDTEPAEDLRVAVRTRLSSGRTAEQVITELVQRTSVGRRKLWSIILEEEARGAGELNSYDPTPATVVDLRDRDRHRWERIAARVFGDAGARATEEVKRLYDEARGPGASRRSYTGRGRRFPDME